MIQVWCYDENGFFTESIFVEELKENMIEVPITFGFYKAKWDGEKWIEGATEEEKEKLFPTKAPEPSQEDVLRAKIIKDGVAMQLQQAQQQKVIANLLTQVATLTTQISKLGGQSNG